MPKTTPLVKARGFSIVELLVAMTIGLFLVGGAIQILTQGKHAYNLISETLNIQESARFASRRIGNLLRMAGHRGGVLMTQVDHNFSSLTGDGVCESKWLVDNFADEPVRAYENGTGIVDTGQCATQGITDVNHVDNTDVLVVRHSEAKHESNPGNTDNQNRIFVYTIVSLGAKIGLGSDIATDWSTFSGQPEKVYGRFVYPYYTDVYFVRPWTRNASETPAIPALVRQRMDGSSVETEVMVSGIELLKVELGVDSNDDSQVDKYLAPSAVTSSEWSDVMLARVAIVARSMSRDQIEDTNTYILLPGENEYSYTPSTSVTHFSRMLFEVSINLRNTVPIRTAG
ncbi:PilW family protein [Thiorhodococcus minor]|uniref:Prepilin-type N-terminal cleavage/methylation domain-containing protein n=1 Tax=Thiorhodococcus minor TaxID=57489 RepID=A0A6M0K0V2_9GAMM|nr:PilW family protein [Thiorhodococcus minor]NEV62961.1 hypothetical protein [Thiorhodococcus minor]